MTAPAKLFNTFRKKPPVDPHPNAFTEEERASIKERLDGGYSVRAHIVRKLMRLSDERMVKLQRIERLVEQAKERPHTYPGAYVASIIGDILEGRELDG